MGVVAFISVLFMQHYRDKHINYDSYQLINYFEFPILTHAIRECFMRFIMNNNIQL
jgi:hypothetical protein